MASCLCATEADPSVLLHVVGEGSPRCPTPRNPDRSALGTAWISSVNAERQPSSYTSTWKNTTSMADFMVRRGPPVFVFIRGLPYPLQNMFSKHASPEPLFSRELQRPLHTGCAFQDQLQSSREASQGMDLSLQRLREEPTGFHLNKKYLRLIPS